MKQKTGILKRTKARVTSCDNCLLFLDSVNHWNDVNKVMVRRTKPKKRKEKKITEKNEGQSQILLLLLVFLDNVKQWDDEDEIMMIRSTKPEKNKQKQD